MYCRDCNKITGSPSHKQYFFSQNEIGYPLTIFFLRRTYCILSSWMRQDLQILFLKASVLLFLTRYVLQSPDFVLLSLYHFQILSSSVLHYFVPLAVTMRSCPWQGGAALPEGFCCSPCNSSRLWTLVRWNPSCHGTVTLQHHRNFQEC